MDITTRVCDHCGETLLGIHRFEVPVAHQTDSADKRSELRTDSIDLCPVAMASIVKELIANHSTLDGIAFMRRWSIAIPPNPNLYDPASRRS